MTAEPPALTWSESCDLGEEPLPEELTGSARDLLGQRAAEWRLIGATIVDHDGSYL